MALYDFTLKFALGQQDADPESYVDRLYEAGCDDALIGIGKRGRIALDFSREADSAEQALLSAINNVKQAIPDAVFIEATPDFVGVPDIANVLGVSRQYIGKIVARHASRLPPPAHAGARDVWHLETMLRWLVERGLREVDTTLIEISRANMRLNHARERSHFADEIPDTLMQAVR